MGYRQYREPTSSQLRLAAIIQQSLREKQRYFGKRGRKKKVECLSYPNLNNGIVCGGVPVIAR